MVDIQLNLEHLIYIFVSSITWLVMTFWGRSYFLRIYDPLPALAQTFITIAFWVGGGGMLIGVGLVLYTVLE